VRVSQQDTAGRFGAKIVSAQQEGMSRAERHGRNWKRPDAPFLEVDFRMGQNAKSSLRAMFSAVPQGTKSLRSSPLRGSKSREAAAGREDSDGRRGKVNTISSCVVGVQRMIKNSKDHLRAGTLMRRVTRPRPITQ